MVERSTNSFVYKIAFGGPFVVPPKEHPPVSLWGFYLRFLFKLLFAFPLLWIYFGLIVGTVYVSLFMVAKCPDLDAKGSEKLARDIGGWPTIFGRRIYPIVVLLLGLVIWATFQYPATMIKIGGVFLGVVIGILIIWLGKILKSKICPTVTFVSAEAPKHGGLENC